MIMWTASNRRRRPIGAILAWMAATLAMVLLVAGPASAAAVSIHDDSHVLDVTRIQNEAATLPDPVEIYTTSKFADDKAAFDRETESKVSSPTVIVIAINTQSHHLAIRTGPKSRVTQQAARTATVAFVNSYRGNPDYTAAAISALASMRAAIRKGNGRGAAPARPTATHSSAGSYVSGLICLLLVALVVVAIIVATKRTRRLRQHRSAGSGGF
jgi:hypothetical protein